MDEKEGSMVGIEERKWARVCKNTRGIQ